MTTTYTTIQNDRLDKIARHAYGTERNGNLEMILEANRGLGDQPPSLPSGIVIALPDPPSGTPIRQTVKLWD